MGFFQGVAGKDGKLGPSGDPVRVFNTVLYLFRQTLELKFTAKYISNCFSLIFRVWKLREEIKEILVKEENKWVCSSFISDFRFYSFNCWNLIQWTNWCGTIRLKLESKSQWFKYVKPIMILSETSEGRRMKKGMMTISIRYQMLVRLSHKLNPAVS